MLVDKADIDFVVVEHLTYMSGEMYVELYMAIEHNDHLVENLHSIDCMSFQKIVHQQHGNQ